MSIMRKTNFAFAMAAVLITTGIHTQVRATEEQGSIPYSEVNVSFKEGDASVGPLDPEDPTKPGVDIGTPEESGPLALNYVTNINFGLQDVTALEAKYPSLTIQPYLQVTDVRGTGGGWSITAQASTFQSEGEDSLPGATIRFTSATAVSAVSETIMPPTPVEDFTLKTDGYTEVDVVTAERDTGMGTWLVRWYIDPEAEENNAVKLTVPGGVGMLGEHEATITWILKDVPA